MTLIIRDEDLDPDAVRVLLSLAWATVTKYHRQIDLHRAGMCCPEVLEAEKEGQRPSAGLCSLGL